MSKIKDIEQRIEQALQAVAQTADMLTPQQANAVVQTANVKGLAPQHVLDGVHAPRIVQLWLHDVLLSGKQPLDAQPVSVEGCELLPFSKIVFDQMKTLGPDLWEFPITLQAPKNEVDSVRLRDAIEQAIAHHPVLSTRIDDRGKQYYEPGYRTPYMKYKTMQTDDSVRLELTFNRILGDATSVGVFFENVCRAYLGQSLPKDNYLLYINKVEEHKNTSVYEEHRQQLYDMFGGLSCPVFPLPDNITEDKKSCLGQLYIGLEDMEKPLAALYREKYVTTNVLFSLATALAIMEYNGTDEAALTWAYQGREKAEEQSIFGSLHRDVPLYIRRSASDTPTSLLCQAKQQVEQGIMLSDFPFTFQSDQRDVWSKAVNVLVQPNVNELLESSPIPFQLVPNDSDDSKPAYCMIDVEVCEHPLGIKLNYSDACYTEDSMHSFVNLICDNVRYLLKQKTVKV